MVNIKTIHLFKMIQIFTLKKIILKIPLNFRIIKVQDFYQNLKNRRILIKNYHLTVRKYNRRNLNLFPKILGTWYRTQTLNLVVLISRTLQKIQKTLTLINQIRIFQSLQNHRVILMKSKLQILFNKESKVFTKRQELKTRI